MQYFANDPAMTDCLTAVQNINAASSYQNACDKLYVVNALNCSPADVIDVVITDPVYTPEEISELDCWNEVNQMIVYYAHNNIKCKDLLMSFISYYFNNISSDVCGLLHYYYMRYTDCKPKETSPSTPTLPTPTPTEPITYEPPVMTQPTPVHGFEPVQPSVDRVYYYHGDHLNSSTYVTDDNGRPVAYYDYLPFGETMVEHNQTTNFNNGYKFNAKELDEATGMSYYGARYYDPRISVFVSVDPLAEEFVGWTPYHYVHQNPINLIDPTGMSAEDGNGNPAKNIVINFLRNDRGSKNKPLGNFDNNDLAKNGWHVIDVSTIQEASDKLKKYLNGNKIDNLFINAHGNSITYSYEDGTFADFASGVKLGDIFISGRTLQLYSEGKFDELNDFHKGAVNAISALDDISKMMNTNSNLIFGSCFSGNEHRFGEFISQMNPQMNVFASGDGYYIEHNQKSKKTSFANFSNYAIRREDFEIGMRRYRSGRLIDEGFNIKINNKNGISIFK